MLIMKQAIKIIEDYFLKYHIYLFYFLVICLLLFSVSYFYAYQFTYQYNTPRNSASLLINMFNAYTEELNLNNPAVTQADFYYNMQDAVLFLVFALTSLFVFENFSRMITKNNEIFAPERRIVIFFMLALILSQYFTAFVELFVFHEWGTGISLLVVGSSVVTIVFTIINFIYLLLFLTTPNRRSVLLDFVEAIILSIITVILLIFFITSSNLLMQALGTTLGGEHLGHQIELVVMLVFVLLFLISQEGQTILKPIHVLRSRARTNLKRKLKHKIKSRAKITEE